MADDALVEETLSHLLGLTLDQGQMTWLNAGIDDTQTDISVANQEHVSTGVIEVGEELIYVATSDISGIVAAPFGRGYQRTTAATWPVNTRVTMSPRFPRARIREAINYTVQNVYPKLFVVGTTTLVPDGFRITHELPADAERVLVVRQQAIGPYHYWVPIQGYRVIDAPVSEFPTGKALDIFSGLVPGQDVQVQYMKRPSTLTPLDPFTDTGLSATAWPCVMYGAIHRLLSTVPAGLAGVDSVQAAEAQTRRRVSLAETAREYYALHLQFLTDERERLLEEVDMTSNWEG
jgi:hypothetical protein